VFQLSVSVLLAEHRGLTMGFQAGQHIYYFRKCQERTWIAHSFLFNGQRKIFLGLKRLQREGDHSSLCKVEKMNKTIIAVLYVSIS
jgi:hypothetical protein